MNRYLNAFDDIEDVFDFLEDYAGPNWGEVQLKGHRRGQCILKPSDPRERWCEISFRVKFRSFFGDFRREVERAYERWTDPKTPPILFKKREETLKTMHRQMLASKVPNNAPVELFGFITYRGAKDKWRVVDIEFPLDKNWRVP